MIKFDKDVVLVLYKLLVSHTGGTFGIRDESMLESALSSPYQTFGGEELFKSLIEKAARLGYGLVRNHPFVDGNKRIGIFIMLTFLKVNGYDMVFTDEEIVNIALTLASGNMEYEELLQILESKK